MKGKDGMEALRKAVSEAVHQALSEIGIETFKKTSFFMSNTNRELRSLKEAA